MWTRDGLFLLLLKLQVGVQPPSDMPPAEALASFRSVAGEDADRFKRAADFLFEEIRTFEQRIIELETKLESATEFLIGGLPVDHHQAIYIKKCWGYKLPKEPMWKVQRLNDVLAKDGQWEWEPTPSSRDDDFYERCRFDSFDDALTAANKLSK